MLLPCEFVSTVDYHHPDEEEEFYSSSLVAVAPPLPPPPGLAPFVSDDASDRESDTTPTFSFDSPTTRRRTTNAVDSFSSSSLGVRSSPVSVCVVRRVGGATTTKTKKGSSSSAVRRTERRVRGLWSVHGGSTREDDVFSALHNDIFSRRVLSWLGTADLLSARDVCERWRFCVDDDDARLWERVDLTDVLSRGRSREANDATIEALLGRCARRVRTIVARDVGRSVSPDVLASAVGACLPHRLTGLRLSDAEELTDAHVALLFATPRMSSSSAVARATRRRGDAPRLRTLAIERCPRLTRASWSLARRGCPLLTTLRVNSAPTEADREDRCSPSSSPSRFPSLRPIPSSTTTTSDLLSLFRPPSPSSESATALALSATANDARTTSVLASLVSSSLFVPHDHDDDHFREREQRATDVCPLRAASSLFSPSSLSTTAAVS